MKRSFLWTAFVATLISFPVYAHDVHMVLDTHGDVVRGRITFGHDDPASDMPVSLNIGSEREVARSVTNADGRFAFIVPEPGTYTIVAESMDGHRVDQEFTITEAVIGVATSGVGTEPHAVDRALASRIDALIERIDRLENRTRFRDILGRVGYVLGILGVVALLKRRRTG